MPPIAPYPHRPLPQTNRSSNLPKSPPSVASKPKRTPIPSLETFKHAHNAERQRMGRYWEKGNARQLGRADLEEMMPPAAKFLYANNMQARIEFARISANHVERHFESLGEDMLGFWLTLTPVQFVVDERLSRDFNIRWLHGWVHQVMRGFNYLGMVDIALYTNLQLVLGRKRAVSWHVHMLVWGCEYARMVELRAKLNETYAPLVKGRTAAHFRGHDREKLVARVYYMMKSPKSDYRLVRQRFEHIDLTTGEVTDVVQFDQKKDDLTPKDITKLHEVMVGRCLDQLAFAGGAGKALIREIRDEALKPLRDYERRHQRR